jgi:uncharacterized RDD family membrane protein YckC
MESTCMTESLHEEGKLRPINLFFFLLLWCLYQDRKVSGHDFVLGVSILPL